MNKTKNTISNYSKGGHHLMKNVYSIINKIFILISITTLLFTSFPVYNHIHAEEEVFDTVEQTETNTIEEQDENNQEEVIVEEDDNLDNEDNIDSDNEESEVKEDIESQDNTEEVVEEETDQNSEFEEVDKEDSTIEEEATDFEEETYDINGRTVSNLSNVVFRSQDQIRSYYNSHKFKNIPTKYSRAFKTTSPYDVGDQGQISSDVLNDALNALNVVRYVAGLGEVSLDTTYGNRAQAASFLNYLNNELSHYPVKPPGVSNALFELGEKYGTKQSNLGQYNPTLASAVIDGWMEDGSDGNIPMVGHRRWCLNPKMGKTGFGHAGSYTAMYSFDNSVSNPSTKYSVWPAQNTPIELFGSIYPWTFSTGNTETKSRVSVTLLNLNTNRSYTFSSSNTSTGYFNVNNEGYGLPGCVIFRPNNITYNDGDSYKVTITGLSIGTVTYQVDFFSLISNPVTNITSSYPVYVAKGKSISNAIQFTPSNHNDTIIYSVGNDNITINESGTITGVNVGDDNLWVSTCSRTFENYYVSVKVYNPMTSLTLNKSTLTLNQSQSETLIANVSPSTGTLKDKLVWTSSNNSVATVGYNGYVYANGPGTATITVKNEIENKSATCTVTVKQPVTSLYISPSSVTIGVGETYTISPSISPTNATNKSLTFKSSDSTVANVSSTGVITGKKSGTATITATTIDGSNKSATIKVTVGPAVTGITLNNTTASIKEGGSLRLTATITPSDAINKTITWTSSNTNVATVSGNYITAVSPGTTTITAKTSNGKTATCTVTVYKALSSISVSPSSASITSGNTKQLTVTYNPSNAGNKNVTYSSSNTNVATVDTNGLVTAKAGGTATITVKSVENSNITATCTINVTQLPTGVSLNKPSLTLSEIGNTETLTATVKPTTATNKNVTWSSDKTSVATVIPTGVVTAKNYGTATITVTTSNGYTATCTVRVGVAPSSITINKTSTTLKIGDTETLSATVEPTNAYDKSITWSSGNTNVATVDQNGKITTIGAGYTYIYARSVNSKSVSCLVYVKQPVTSITADDMIITKGTSKNIVYDVLPSNASSKNVTFAIDNPSVAAISSYGKVTAVGVGTTYATITASDGYGASKRVKITVPQSADSISLNKREIYILKGGSESLTATISPENAYDKTITWSSYNNNIATVDQNGNVTAVGVGTTYIAAKTSNNKSALCYIDVRQPVETITLDKTNAEVFKGNLVRLKATVLPTDAYDDGIEWVSSDTSIATVNSQGTVIGITKGIVTITARALDGSGVYATCTVNVMQYVSKINLNKQTLYLNRGSSETLTFTVEPDNANNKEVVWSSQDPTIATVDQNGKVTAVKNGEVWIVATAKDGSKTTAPCYVYVSEPIASINLNTTNKTMLVGDTYQITATVSPSNATNSAIEWSSSNTNVATVDSNGLVTARAKGSATIYARSVDGSNVSATATITVNQPVTSITLNKTTLTINKGYTSSLSATVSPSNANNKAVTWSSSDTSVATVNSSGTVTGVKGGKATITATANDGSGISASCEVTVNVIVTSVTIIPEDDQSKLTGETISFTADVLPQDATNKTLEWTSSNTNVATVDQNGLVTCIGQGTATITARSTDGSNKSSQKSVTVSQAVESITLGETSLFLYGGSTKQLNATILPSNASNKTLEWTSSNTNIAIVSNGLIMANSSGTTGTTTITAKATDGSNVQAQCVVTVGTRLTGINVSPTSKTLSIGEKYKLTANASPTNATNKTLKWYSQDESIVTVDSQGYVTAVAKGSAKIYVESTDGSNIVEEINITVKQDVESVRISKNTLHLYQGDTYALSAEVLPVDADNKSITWTSSDESLAIVNNGTVQIVGRNGTVDIVVKSNDDNTKTAKCTITIGSLVTNIRILEAQKVVYMNETYKLQFQVEPITAADRSVTYMPEDTSVVTVDENGIVTPVSLGQTNILITSNDGSQISNSIKIIVKQRMEDLTIYPQGKNKNMWKFEMDKGTSINLTTIIEPANTSNIELNWISEDDSKVTVNNGTITAVSESENYVRVYARSKDGSNVSDYVEVKVNGKQVTPEPTDLIEGFVTRMYRLCLDREPEQKGLEYWSDLLESKQITAGDAVKGFFDSNEMNDLGLSDEEYIRRCYLVMMDREPDESGMNYWKEMLENGVSRLFIAKGFVDSQEFTNICNNYQITKGTVPLNEPRDQNYGITSFVARCYTKILERPFDAKGINYWCEIILSSTQQKQTAINMAIYDFLNSQEFIKKNLNDAEYVKVLYRSFFDREADQKGLNYWLSELNAGASRNAIAEAFAYSSEFDKIMTSYGIE